MEVLPCSGVHYAGESNSPNQASDKAFVYDGEKHEPVEEGNTKVENFVLNVEDEQFGDESPTIDAHFSGQKLSSNTHDSGVDSLDGDIMERENQECESSPSEPKWLEQDQPMAVWVKWRGTWQAGIRCGRSDWPLPTLRAKPTHDRKQYIVIFFPRTRNYSWADVLLVRPISEFPEPIAYRSHNVGVKVVKDLTLARRFIVQKLAVSMINTIEQLNSEALMESARNVVVWKDFALEASKCKGYSELGRMLLKLENMILQRYLNSFWLEHSLQSWVQRCQNAHTAESIEMLKEELSDAINWNDVQTLSIAGVQPELGTEWKALKAEVMKWFSMSNPSFNNGEMDHQSNGNLANTGLQVSRKRPKLEVRRAEVQPPLLKPHEAPNMSLAIETDSRFFDGLTINAPASGLGPSRDEVPTNKWEEIVVESRNMQENTPLNKNKQCTAFIEAKGRQCVRWANDGEVYCCVHLASRFSTIMSKVEVTPPVSDAQMCEGTTVLGTKCKHRSLSGSSFCKKHRPRETFSPENKLKRKLEDAYIDISEANKCKEIVLSGHFEAPIQVVDTNSSLINGISETMSCIGDNISCHEAPKKHTLYCEKHLPNWLKRARNGKSRIISKEVFIDLLKNCQSHEQKLHLHQACELFYRFFKSVLSLRSPVPKEIQLQWVISEASKDIRIGNFLTKLVFSEKERLIRVWGFNVDNIAQNSRTVEEEPVNVLNNHSFETHADDFSHKFEIGNNLQVQNMNFDNQDGSQRFICSSCGLKFDMITDLERHHQAAHMGSNPIGHRLSKRGVPYFGYKLKSGRLSRPKFKRGLGAMAYKIRNRGAGNLKKHTQTPIGEVIEQQPRSSQTSLGRLAESQCSAVANLLYSKIKKTKPRPGNLEILAIARSSCCKVSFQSSLEKKYGVLPERLYLKAAKLCSEHNILLEWHQDTFICPKGCESITNTLNLSPLASLGDGYVRPVVEVGSSAPLTSEWAMDECHYIINFEHSRQEAVERAIILCDDISFGKESVPIGCVVDEHLLGSLHNDDGQTNAYSLPWESFSYVMKPLLDQSHDLRLQSLQLGCGCAHSTCSPKACDHVYLFESDYEDARDIFGKSMKGRFPYDDNGRIILEEGYLVYECNNNCSCSKNCPNRVLQNGVRLKLEVFKTEEKGWGVRAGEPIYRGTFVCEYLGEIIDEEEADKRRHRYGKEGCSYIYEIDARVNDMIRLIEGEPNYVIDATKYGNVSRYINHSCSPNLENHVVLIDSVDSQLSHIGLYASRDIAMGEELTYDFMYKPLPGEGCQCRCGTSNCRGRLH